MWWFLWVFLLVILSVLLYLLSAPFFISIDTNTGLFEFRFHRLAVCRLDANEDGIVLKIRIAWWRREIDLLRPEQKPIPVPAEQRKKKKSTRPRKRMPAAKMFRKIVAVLKSFRVKRCYIAVDTGNMPLNGVLYPYLFLLSRKTGHTVTINFWGEETIVLHLQNSLARMAWAYIKTN